MSAYEKLELRKTYSFDVYPAGIISSSFKDVKILGFLDMDTARRWIDPEAMHVNVYPTIPPEVAAPDDPEDYVYVKVKFPNGEVTVIGEPWIKAETIVASGAGTLSLTIPNVSQTDKTRIINALAAVGKRPSTVSFK